MDQTAFPARNGGIEMASNALSAGVMQYLRSVRRRGGTIAFDKVAANLVADVCAALVLEFGSERLFELFDSIEANSIQLSPTLAAHGRLAVT